MIPNAAEVGRAGGEGDDTGLRATSGSCYVGRSRVGRRPGGQTVGVCVWLDRQPPGPSRSKTPLAGRTPSQGREDMGRMPRESAASAASGVGGGTALCPQFDRRFQRYSSAGSGMKRPNRVGAGPRRADVGCPPTAVDRLLCLRAGSAAVLTQVWFAVLIALAGLKRLAELKRVGAQPRVD